MLAYWANCLQAVAQSGTITSPIVAQPLLCGMTMIIPCRAFLGLTYLSVGLRGRMGKYQLQLCPDIQASDTLSNRSMLLRHSQVVGNGACAATDDVSCPAAMIAESPSIK